VLAGHAEMHYPLRQKLRDLGSREIGHLDPGKIRDRAAVIASAARLDEVEARAGEKCFGVLLQAALGRNRDHKSGSHGAAPHAASRSIHAANPTAGIGSLLPSRVSKPS